MANETKLAQFTDSSVIDFLEQQTIESAATQKVFRPVLQTPRSVIDFSGPGDKKLIVQTSAMTFAALTEWDGTGNATNTLLDPTSRELAPVLVGCHFQISYEAETYSSIDPLQMITDEAAIAWATAEDSAATISYAACYTEAPSTTPDHEIGGAVALDFATIRQGAMLLRTAKARPPYSLFLDPIQVGHVYQDSQCVALLKEGGTQPSGYSTTEGIRMDQFVGKILGVNLWCVPGGMITATTLRAMMVGQNALGIAYKRISTPLSPTSSELNIDVDWNAQHRYFTVALTSCFDVAGIVFTSTTNKWMVDIATATS